MKKIKILVPYLIISIILIVGMLIKVYADYLYSSSEVYYENNNSTLLSADLQSAIEELDTKCENRIASAGECPEGYKCTEIQPICKRATTLHTETCTNTDTSGYCIADGYYAAGSKGTTTITYGSLGTSGTLTSGDAFDCDVNGNGIIDTDTNGNSTERFYYVSDYYDTQSKTVNDDYAVLIYYNNTKNGVANTAGSAYATQADSQTVGTCSSSNGCNWYGPVSAIKNLPTTSQWSNVSLYKTSRAILAEDRSTHDAPSTSGGTLPTAFSYSGYAARLLTAKELMNGCGLTQVGNGPFGELSGCNYLFENTKYSSSSLATNGPWLETPYSSNSSYAWFANDNYRRVGVDLSYTSYGARPVIEVPKSQISY